MDVTFVHSNFREVVVVAADFLNALGKADQLGKQAFFEQLDELF